MTQLVANKEVKLRDNKGRFQNGHSGLKGAGRPSKHAFFANCWDGMFHKEHFEKMAWKLYELGLKGDKVAMFYFVDRCLGKMSNNLNLDVDANQPKFNLKELIEQADREN